ncbi:ABC transporter permease [Massilia sp. Dwa41.01b]|uniref:ABC transporter permease n=1 Tax=Massilia sp. Dwa41.01b TaxID=2709302 RepID=UPI001E4FE488|nr:ABC transporter permease [Massilia sp. Dwa41.01b]
MTAFLALVRKDLILFVHDRRALLVSLALPIIIATFFGFLFGGGDKQNSAIELALVMEDDSGTAKAIAAGLEADPGLALVRMTAQQARQAVRTGERKAAIVIPAGFGEAASGACSVRPRSRKSACCTTPRSRPCCRWSRACSPSR